MKLAGLMPLLAIAGCTHGATENHELAKAPLHSRLLTLDTHLDTPTHFARAGWSFGDRHSLSNDMAQIDIPRMAGGNLDGGFFVIYTAQGPLTAEGYAAARAIGLKRSDEIDSTIARFPKQIEFARSAADVRRIATSGKLVALKSMENSYPLGEDLGLLAEYHKRGLRLAGPVHSANNQFADSATDKPRWNGLSPLGREWVKEMNRLGIVIDPSHSSDAAFDQMLELSKTPLLLSHSGSKTLFDHPRNLDDARIRKLAERGGAICVTSVYLAPMKLGAERGALFEKFDRIGELSPAEQTKLAADWRALDTKELLWDATFDDFMRALVHVIKIAGVDHTCIGADWDGGGGLPGIEDITALPKVTERLKAEGYSDVEIEKIWSGNILRILSEAESVVK
jgi:membrane dipeptidase